jgi:streptogramin lyase
MFQSKARISSVCRPAALRLLVIASLALLGLTVSGGWTAARAEGPALWMASPEQTGVTGATGGIIEVRPFQLLKSGVPKRIKIKDAFGPLANSAGIAFQPNGALWVTTLNNTVLKFTPAQLSNLSVVPHPKPKVKITSSSFGFNIGCAFDSHVNLWIVDSLNDAIHEISHAQLAAGTAEVTPAVTITDTTDLTSPSFAAFDATGDIWISSLSNSKLVEFSASQLANSGSPIPNVIISSTSLNEPGEIAFDGSGNLWVTNAGNDTVVEFTAAQLTATGSPAANVVISDDGSGSLATPWGLQFDDTQRLWVFDYMSGHVVKYGPGQLAATGSPTPRITLTGLPLFSAQIIFGPKH